jgi:hypothetical protein
VAGGSLLAVFTISLYQYNITNFNSIAGEQLMMYACLGTYLGIASVYTTRKNLLRHLKRPRVAIRAISGGLASVMISFAFLFAPSSIITTAKRTSAILWAILSRTAHWGKTCRPRHAVYQLNYARDIGVIKNSATTEASELV